MMIRIYSLNLRSRPAAIALGAAALAAGAALLAFGIILLIGVAAVGSVVGGGVLLYRSLTGRRTSSLRPGRDLDLDPSLEVFQEHRPAEVLPPSLTRPAGPEPD